MIKNRKRITKKGVQYYIIIKDNNINYTLGSIKIDKFNGDIYYFPSFNLDLQLRDGNYSEKRKIEHMSFHKSGEFHIKVKRGNRKEKLTNITDCIIEVGKECSYGLDEDVSKMRTPLKNVKIQNMFQIFIKNIERLTLFNKKLDEIDLLFDVSNIKTHLLFSFSICSGKLIVNQSKGNSCNNIQLNTIPRDIVINRCLGYESGNADKLLQYSISRLDKYDFDGNINLRLFYDNPINKMNFE